MANARTNGDGDVLYRPLSAAALQTSNVSRRRYSNPLAGVAMHLFAGIASVVDGGDLRRLW